MQKSLCTVVVQHHIRNNNSKGVMNSKVPKYSTISTNIWAELLREINGVNDDDDGDDEGDDDDDDDDGDAPAGALRIWKFSTERNKKGRKKKKEHFGTGNDNNDIIHEIRNERKLIVMRK